MKTLVILASLALATVASAECRQGPGGRTICSNGDKAAVYNPNTGTAKKVEQNSNGVNSVQGSRGGEAKTKNGMGVVQGPNGTTCVKGKNNAACK